MDNGQAFDTSHMDCPFCGGKGCLIKISEAWSPDWYDVLVTCNTHRETYAALVPSRPGVEMLPLPELNEGLI